MVGTCPPKKACCQKWSATFGRFSGGRALQSISPFFTPVKVTISTVSLCTLPPGSVNRESHKIFADFNPWANPSRKIPVLSARILVRIRFFVLFVRLLFVTRCTDRLPSYTERVFIICLIFFSLGWALLLTVAVSSKAATMERSIVCSRVNFSALLLFCIAPTKKNRIRANRIQHLFSMFSFSSHIPLKVFCSGPILVMYIHIYILT